MSISKLRNMIGLLSIIGLIIILVCSRNNSTEHCYKDNRLYSSDIVFSKASGFYDDEFELSISAPTDEIYYTFDCSEPDMDSHRYTGPIIISDATNQENRFSNVIDVSGGFYEKLIERLGDEIQPAPGYRIPNTKIDKCTVLKACYYDENGKRSEVHTATYFVGFGQKEYYDNISVISVTTDSDNLFDNESGIYVTGESFNSFVANGGMNLSTNPMAKYWWWWAGNYSMRGKDWERESVIQFYNEKHELELTQSAGIRIQGGGSRGYNPKSLNIYARDEYDGNDVFYYDFWNNGYLVNKITISACGDDRFSKIQDRLIAELCEQARLDVHYFHYRPCLLFLDGEFWGFYYIVDSVNAREISQRYGVNEDNVVVLKNALLEEGTDSDAEDLSEAMEYVVSNDMNSPEVHESVWNYFDKDSTLDYFASMIYIARCGDFVPIYANSAIWRTRSKEQGAYGDTKYRWIIYDVNSGGMFGEKLSDVSSKDLSSHDTIRYLRKASEMFDRLCENEDFYNSLIDKVMELGEDEFSPANTKTIIEIWREELKGPMELHMERFFGKDNSKFIDATYSVEAFFQKRYDAVWALYGE